jgi:hypothetical protein
VTLAWEPLLFTTAGSRTLSLRFYNNDVCRHFRIVAEGMDEKGRLLHLEEVIGANGPEAGGGPGVKKP